MPIVEAPSQIGLAEPLIAAIDNGGTRTRIAIRLGDEQINFGEYPTPQDYGEAVVRIGATTLSLTEGKTPDAAGFAIAGKIKNRVIVSAGQLQEYGWCWEPFGADLSQYMGMPLESTVFMNDCVAAAKAQQVVNDKRRDVDSGYVATISTGFGGAGFNVGELIPDEPGHEYLKPGATCGCGQEGHVEAHISGSGIERKYSIKGEDLPERFWPSIIEDAVEAHVQLLNRLHDKGFDPAGLYYFGSVALKSPYMLPGLRQGLQEQTDRLPAPIGIFEATHGDDSGLVGAGDAALELARV